MELKLNRVGKQYTYTIGKLFIDGVYFCDTMEDKDRGLSQTTPITTIEKIKVPSQTAIPTGLYKVAMNQVSPRLSKKDMYKGIDGKLPRLIDVPGFDGVLIHPGNTSSDTSGCILVGQNKIKGKVVNSVSTFDKLMNELLKDNDNIVLTID